MAAELGFDIVANNRASKGINAVAKDFQGLETKASAAGKNSGKGFRSGFDKNIKGVGSKLKGALKVGAAAAGAAAGAVIVEGLSQAIELGDVGARIGAQLQLDPAATAEAAKVAGRIYSENWGESLDQVKQAAVGVAQNLNTAVESVDFQPLVTDALIFSDVFEQDVTRSIQTVGRLMKTDMVKDGREGFDVLTRLFQEVGFVSDDLLDTLTEYPTQFRDLGLSAEDAMGLMIQGLQGGARDSDTVADALKELRIRVVDLSAEDALEKLGLDADKMASAFAKGGPKAREALGTILEKLRGVKDPAKRARLAVELFGTKAEDMAGALNSMDLSKARDEIGKVEGATRDAGDTATDSIKSDMAAAWRSVTGDISRAVTIISGDTDHVGGMIEGLTNTAKKSMDRFAGNSKDSMGKAGRSMNRGQRAAQRLADAIRGVPSSKTPKVNTQVRGTGDVAALQRAINNLRGRTITVTARADVGGIQGGFFTTNVHGGPVKRGEISLVGEEGPEIVQFSGDGQVFPHRESMQMMRGGGGSALAGASPQRVVVEFDFRGDSDLVRFFRKAINARGGSVQKVLGS